ncbi:hypothetical protein NE619_11050 [Anaerovorax odorimutans]|uniref:Family 2 glycosyl transferase n=1 Tax=Anaerovorax odorimutans TaxID=109327 RepID=A0ABT1RPZ7_9FIRM|nr:hypothetical protein [Anaerovorax odorimutans]MCQ4637260.1 hypothetical protein [Anaerovorax odorimutans]
MKKFLIVCACLLLGYMGLNYVYYNTSFPWTPDSGKPLEVQAKTQGKDILMKKDGGWEKITVCGMNMGSGYPGHYATDFAINYNTYIQWFKMMQAMNVNVLRIYTIQNDTFYKAFYDYNKGRKNPLYLIHGIWVDDYAMRSHLDAFSKEVHDAFIDDCKKVVDIIHGRRHIGFNSDYGSGEYEWDISPYVIGYVAGVEWEPDLVVYTNDKRDEIKEYQGTYFSTEEGASPFECFLAETGDRMMEYEVKKYSQQRLLAFANWPETDPLDHKLWSKERTNNFVKVDVEHIRQEAAVKSGTFASYHVYPYYPPFMYYEKQFLKNGRKNGYKTYLKALNKHHADKPVLVTEFGLPSARGIAQRDLNRGLDQGNLSEDEQGKGLQLLFTDIMDSGCAGGMVFTWQDEWFKRTWNTWPNIDSTRTPFWSDIQTNEQMFGIITFDPGEVRSICYVDGDISEWQSVKPVIEKDDMSLSMVYDERALYIRVHKKDLDLEKEDVYIPLDTTPKSGAVKDETHGLKYSMPADFVIEIKSEKDAEIQVQEYYNTTETLYGSYIHRIDPYLDPPDKDSGVFEDIKLYLRRSMKLSEDEWEPADLFNTGKLRPGNGNPNSREFNFLTDYCVSGDEIEIRIPWGLINFSDPSNMRIHDDYYKHYGVENLSINHLNTALYTRKGGRGGQVSSTGFAAMKLEGWGNLPTYHQRIKKSYYYMQEIYGKYLKEGA